MRNHGSTTWVIGLVMALVAVAFVAWNMQSEAGADILVYKSLTCHCCDRWVAHLRRAGFKVYVRTQERIAPLRAKHGVPQTLASCHTAIAGNYTIEGHVPASAIRRLLKERPAVAGLAVPGMPIGSPGMEQGNRREPFDVIAFDEAGRTTVFAEG